MISSVLNPANSLGTLPPAPGGQASLIGGTLSNLDPLRDQIVVQAFGGGRNTLLFDERTHVYIDGRAASLHDLKEGQHIYAETVLDRADVFARSIHIATQDVAEQTTGQIVAYDSNRNELVLRDALFSKAVRLHVNRSTTLMQGDRALNLSELRPGALVNVRFTISAGHEPLARQVSVLAQAGTAFVFPGRVTLLDLHTGILVLLDPRDNKSYELFCDPAVVPVPQDLREGSNVTVSANFDGTRYSATAITLDPAQAR